MLAIRFVVLTVLMAGGTWLAGWWAVPVVAALYGAAFRWSRGSALISGLAGMAGWGALLGITALGAPVGQLATILGGVLNVRAIGVYGLTLCYPGLLALTAALVARSVARMVVPAR
jgi:hypothetical protein